MSWASTHWTATIWTEASRAINSGASAVSWSAMASAPSALVMNFSMRDLSGKRIHDHPGEPQHLGPVVEPGDRVPFPQPVDEVPTERGQRIGAGRAVPHHAPGFRLMVREAVHHEVFLGREVGEERALGNLGRLGDLRHRDLVEAVFEEQLDRRVGDRRAGPLLLPLTQSWLGVHGVHPST